MLLLGIDSQFAYIEAVATVLMDAGIGDKLPRPLLSGAEDGFFGDPLVMTNSLLLKMAHL
jgi:hypothetical protein